MTPKTNVIFARYRFHEKVQGASEPFEQFVTDLKLLVQDCNYANSEEMIRDRIVFRIHSPRVREKLLNVGSDLTLEKAVDIARSHDMAQAQLKTIASGSGSGPREQTVHAISRQSKYTSSWKKRDDNSKRNPDRISRALPQEGDSDKKCGYCGYKAHGARESCPAKGKKM